MVKFGGADGRLRLQTDRMDPNHVPYMNIKLMICVIPAALTPPVISRDVGLMAAVLWVRCESVHPRFSSFFSKVNRIWRGRRILFLLFII